MVTSNLNVVRVACAPREAKAPLVVDSNAVLSHPLAFELFESVGRWDAQGIQQLTSFQLIGGNQLDQGRFAHLAWTRHYLHEATWLGEPPRGDRPLGALVVGFPFTRNTEYFYSIH